MARAIGIVRWFNQYKGYGFLDVEEVGEDVFIHFSLLDSIGLKELHPMDEVECEIEQSGKGYHVTKIYSIQVTENDIAQELQEVLCTLKWFNPAKGYGFAENDVGEDIFIHGSLFESIGAQINSGDRLIAKVCKQRRGYEAVAIELA